MRWLEKMQRWRGSSVFPAAAAAADLKASSSSRTDARTPDRRPTFSHSVNHAKPQLINTARFQSRETTKRGDSPTASSFWKAVAAWHAKTGHARGNNGDEASALARQPTARRPCGSRSGARILLGTRIDGCAGRSERSTVHGGGTRELREVGGRRKGELDLREGDGGGRERGREKGSGGRTLAALRENEGREQWIG